MLGAHSAAAKDSSSNFPSRKRFKRRSISVPVILVHGINVRICRSPFLSAWSLVSFERKQLGCHTGSTWIQWVDIERGAGEGGELVAVGPRRLSMAEHDGRSAVPVARVRTQ
jgi:hypothetical protein